MHQHRVETLRFILMSEHLQNAAPEAFAFVQLMTIYTGVTDGPFETSTLATVFLPMLYSTIAGPPLAQVFMPLPLSFLVQDFSTDVGGPLTTPLAAVGNFGSRAPYSSDVWSAIADSINAVHAKGMAFSMTGHTYVLQICITV